MWSYGLVPIIIEKGKGRLDEGDVSDEDWNVQFIIGVITKSN